MQITLMKDTDERTQRRYKQMRDIKQRYKQKEISRSWIGRINSMKMKIALGCKVRFQSLIKLPIAFVTEPEE